MNKILILDAAGNPQDLTKYPKIACDFRGDNSIVVIDNPKNINGAQFNLVIGSGCEIRIGKNFQCYEHLQIYAIAQGSKFTIGDDCWVGGLNVSLRDEPNLEISIGNDCLIGSNCAIRSSDGHTIFDINTREVLNKPGNIVIHDHVWFGRGVEVLKSTEIQSNTVVGMGSVVTKKFSEGNCVLAGRPAKVVKSGVNWSKLMTHKFK